MHYELGPYSLDTTTMVISCAKEALDCDDRVVLLLKLLAEHYPGHCEAQFLLDQLWPKRVVSVSSLARLVSDARVFFKSQGCDEQLIQTVHGRGYRLAHGVLKQASALPSQSIDSFRSKKAVTVASAVIAISLVIGAKFLPFNSAASLKIAEAENVHSRILWVDDHPRNNDTEIEHFEQQQIAVYKVTSSKDALALLEMYQYELIISDMGRNDNPLAGLHLVEAIRKKGNATPYIIYTIMPSEAQKQIAYKYGANAVAVDKDELFSFANELLIRQTPGHK